MSFQFPSPSRFSPSQSYPSQYQRPYPHLPTSTEYGQPLLYGQPFLYGQPPPYSNGAQDYPVDHRWDIQSGRSPYRYQPYSSSYRSKMVSPLRLPPVGLGTSKHPPPSSNIFSNTSDPFLHSAPIPSQSFDQNHAHTIDPPIVPYSIPVTSPDFNAMAGGLYTADASFASDMGYMAFAGDDNVEVHPSDQWLVNNLLNDFTANIGDQPPEPTAGTAMPYTMIGGAIQHRTFPTTPQRICHGTISTSPRPSLPLPANLNLTTKDAWRVYSNQQYSALHNAMLLGERKVYIHVFPPLTKELLGALVSAGEEEYRKVHPHESYRLIHPQHRIQAQKLVKVDINRSRNHLVTQVKRLVVLGWKFIDNPQNPRERDANSDLAACLLEAKKGFQLLNKTRKGGIIGLLRGPVFESVILYLAQHAIENNPFLAADWAKMVHVIEQIRVFGTLSNGSAFSSVGYSKYISTLTTYFDRIDGDLSFAIYLEYLYRKVRWAIRDLQAQANGNLFQPHGIFPLSLPEKVKPTWSQRLGRDVLVHKMLVARAEDIICGTLQRPRMLRELYAGFYQVSQSTLRSLAEVAVFACGINWGEKIRQIHQERGQVRQERGQIHWKRVHRMGMPQDMTQRQSLARVDDPQRRIKIENARDIIYNKNYAVDTDSVEKILKEQSLVPTQNAFSKKLGPLGLDFFLLFVVDLMHEFELGVWRALFTHLLRILNAQDKILVYELDRRFRQVPTFGRETIRRFSNNISELKRLAARDFEDILQCAIPVFEGLLPEPHNSQIMDLIFSCAHWHGLAKLRMHTDDTLSILDGVTVEIGAEFRKFIKKTCSVFTTHELEREKDARQRRRKKQKERSDKPGGSSTAGNHGGGDATASGSTDSATRDSTAAPRSQPSEQHTDPSNPSLSLPNASPTIFQQMPQMDVRTEGSPGTSISQGVEKDECRQRVFSVRGYKYHSLGDYSDMIRRYGTADSYSTEPGELEHRTPKSRYRRTDKKQFVRQLTQIERREARLRRIRSKTSSSWRETKETTLNTPLEHYHIGLSSKKYLHIGTFLRENSRDPAFKNLLPKLKAHLLNRIVHSADRLPLHGNISSTSATDTTQSIVFKQDRIYEHNIARFNYTTYDVRRAQDVIHRSTSHCDIMVLNLPHDNSESTGSNHPYRYGRVLGIYHANVIYIGPGMVNYQPRRMDFLWVRWFVYDESSPAGWIARRLDQIQFPPVNAEYSFGFVDPSEVLRACHIIPRFAGGKRHIDNRGLSSFAKDSLDWKSYYVNRFVDRDVLMRYHFGLGVGHLYTRPQALHSETSEEDSELLSPGLGSALGDDEEGENDDEVTMNGMAEEGGDLGDDLDDLDDHDDEIAEADLSDDEEFLAHQEMYRE